MMKQGIWLIIENSNVTHKSTKQDYSKNTHVVHASLLSTQRLFCVGQWIHSSIRLKSCSVRLTTASKCLNTFVSQSMLDAMHVLANLILCL